MNEITNLLQERELLCTTADAADSAASDITKRIKSLVFPNEILDETETIVTADGSFQVVINSRLEWDQDELAKLVADPDCGPYIKERLGVIKKDYENMPFDIKAKFSEAVTRKTGTLKIKRV